MIRRLTRPAICLFLVALAGFLPPVEVAGAAPLAVRRRCGPIDGRSIFAFNLSCRRAERLWRGPHPRSWSGANIDVDGGEAFLYRQRDEARVIEARGRHGINRRKLGRAPLVFAYVPYGE